MKIKLSLKLLEQSYQITSEVVMIVVIWSVYLSVSNPNTAPNLTFLYFLSNKLTHQTGSSSRCKD